MNHSNRPAHGPSAADQKPDSVPNTTAGLAASGPSVRQPSTEHSRSDNSPTELELLLEALCEERLTPELVQRLEQLVLTSPESRWQYLTYLDLHGTLFWDAAGAGSPNPGEIV